MAIAWNSNITFHILNEKHARKIVWNNFFYIKSKNSVEVPETIFYVFSTCEGTVGNGEPFPQPDILRNRLPSGNRLSNTLLISSGRRMQDDYITK
ncbi:MAG: hypothetical protein J6T06_07430, partial [Victivallales bacterium]|nr:hypothetical protein [Victivallales bacterium]